MRRCAVCQLSFFIFLAAVVCLVSGCGGGTNGGPSNPVPPANPIPVVVTVSPNSSNQNAAAFTLSVVGSNFTSKSVIRWNGSDRPTTLINGNLLTAQISTGDTSSVGAQTVTVVNPSPGGGTSNAKSFAVPCDIPAPTAAANQTRARVGAYFFDGWTGPLTNFHFDGLLNGEFKDREPLSGWQDGNECSIEKQLATAHNFGINFFVYEWYFNTAVNANGEQLNSALQITHALPNRHGMQFAIMYVNGTGFNIPQSDWSSAVDEWVSYMSDPDYVRLNGKPLFLVLDVGQMRNVFGTATGVRAAWDQLRAAAQTAGLPGVFILGNSAVPEGTLNQDPLCCGFPTLGTDGYDAMVANAGPYTAPPVNGASPYSTIADIEHWAWNQSTLHSPIPAIPALMDGWDSRPWDERSSTGILMWYNRTPQEVAKLADDAIEWANTNPQLRPEPSPALPIVLIASWNEVGEGNHILPTVGEGTSYGDAIANMLLGP